MSCCESCEAEVEETSDYGLCPKCQNEEDEYALGVLDELFKDFEPQAN